METTAPGRARSTAPDGHPAGGRPGSRSAGARREAAAGAVLMAAVAAVGLVFAWHPGPSLADRWVALVVHPSGQAALGGVTSLRYPQCIVIGSLLVAAVALPTDRLRSLACLVGPPAALATCELLVKPLVGRHIGAGLSYPSGSTVGAAALGTALVLAVPRRWRSAALVLGVAYTAWMGMAVVALQWHYPTDALAGAAWGAGVVLAVDATIRWAADSGGG